MGRSAATAKNVAQRRCNVDDAGELKRAARSVVGIAGAAGAWCEDFYEKPKKAKGQGKGKGGGKAGGKNGGGGKGGGKQCGKGQASNTTGKTDPANDKKNELPDLSEHLIKCGVYEEYIRWREAYRNWREGNSEGAQGEGSDLAQGAATTDGPLLLNKSWRDDYRSWRKGGVKGAHGEMEVGRRRSKTAPASGEKSLPPVIYDTVMSSTGEPALVPCDGPSVDPMPIKDFPGDAVITIRVFRFFEDHSDHKMEWEKNLLNVNSGSIFWLPWHLAPNLHTKAGAKYGTWFTVHYVQVYAKHFMSAYHMCEEGYAGGAKTFGSSAANLTAVTGEKHPEGYFWYVSPAQGQDHLRKEGWQQGWLHLDRDGPYDGKQFLKIWKEQNSPMCVQSLQRILDKVMEETAQRQIR